MVCTTGYTAPLALPQPRRRRPVRLVLTSVFVGASGASPLCVPFNPQFHFGLPDTVYDPDTSGECCNVATSEDVSATTLIYTVSQTDVGHTPGDRDLERLTDACERNCMSALSLIQPIFPCTYRRSCPPHHHHTHVA